MTGQHASPTQRAAWDALWRWLLTPDDSADKKETTPGAQLPEAAISEVQRGSADASESL